MAIDCIPQALKLRRDRRWWRATVDDGLWQETAAGLAAGRWTLISLWGEAEGVRMALADEAYGEIGVVSLPCPERRFPSVGRQHPPALRLERAARDLFGLEADGAPDHRPWLDHGRWGVRYPLGLAKPDSAATPYEFLPVQGEGVHQIPVGPIHAGIIEPGHFRFSVNGETVVRLEQRLGYVHKGIEGLMAGTDPVSAVRLAGRASGDSTVAFALAFCQAGEAAMGIDVPRRAVWLRALMAELERLANHFGDIGAICNDAAFAILQARFALLREEVLRAAADCFGHRLMMDRILPGGTAVDLPADGPRRLARLVEMVRRQLPRLVELYENTASLKGRTVGTGLLSPELARRFGAGGYIGRASGRQIDARLHPGYPPYDQLTFEVPVLNSGDVNARVWVRISEVEQSLGLVEQILGALPDGPTRGEAAAGQGEQAAEGGALVEGFRGDIFVWLRLGGDGRVERCHLRDPSWFQWPLLEAAIEGNIVADFPLCNKSFNCSYSGQDG